MPRLEISAKGQPTQIVEFNGPTLGIGRQEGNDVVLKDPVASRKHCIIEHRKGHFYVKDLGSHNGTWMGENRIVEAAMELGDSFRIGSTVIRLIPDEVNVAETGEIPSAEIVLDDDDEVPDEPPVTSSDPTLVATTLAVRALVGGPLARQLSTLMQACVTVPVPPGAPQVVKDVTLLNRKSEPQKPAAHSKAGEAFEALRQLLFVAFRTRATDIHVEPKAEVYALRFRIDGQMQSVGEVTTKMALAILNVIKILCEIDIAKRSIVQEGSFAVELPTRRVDFRVNFTPTMHGQKLALRLLDPGAVPTHFENLGMELDAVAELQRICDQDAGMIILSGPTGSGKTTTMYTALQSINATTRNIVTIEDPVEYELSNTTQISIDPVHGVTFATVLSSVLRQDPDVILVGEIRDQETARLAMQAATTGHLVLTTIHARDTIGTVFRLLDLGIESFLVANAVTLCISQRLVRVLCAHCKRPYKPDAKTVRKMNLEGRSFGSFFEAVGCKKCMGTGFRGRIAIYEMLLFTPAVRDVVLSGPTISEIRKAAGEWMFHTLLDTGYKKVIEGITTVSEVERVASMS
ncbi:MAG: type II secretion system protein GspE [Planctomycetota bacterium]|nr:MAG: type II secretion system protein GspE [Planctomycetota bacterium]